MAIAQLAETAIHYEIMGTGEPVLLVAGLGGAASYWGPNIEALANDYQLILHDHRGTGRSARFEGVYSVEMMAADLLALMDHLGIEKAHLVGHSTGGAIGQVLGAIAPERIASLVLYATWAERDPLMQRCLDHRSEIAAQMGAEAYHRTTPLFLYPPLYVRDNAAKIDGEIAAAIAGTTSVSIMQARIAGILGFDGSQYLDRITAPTLVLVTDDDVLTPPYCSHALAARIDGAVLRQTPYGGHAMSRTEPALFNSIVLDFLAQHPIAGTAA